MKISLIYLKSISETLLESIMAIICTLWKRDFSRDREGHELDFWLKWGTEPWITT